MKRTMIAKQEVQLPFYTIEKGEQVVVEPSSTLFEQKMSYITLKTMIGEMLVHMPTVQVESLFEDVKQERQMMDEGLQKLLDTLTGQSKEKPRVRLTGGNKFFVVTAFNQGSAIANVGDVLTVLGHQGECPIVKFPSGVQAKLDKSFYNVVIPMSTEAPSKSLDQLKRKHYLDQGFVSSGGLLVKRVSDRQAQVIKEENLDVVRVLKDNKLYKVIDVDWSGSNVQTMA